MHRWVVLLALVGCDTPPEPDPAPRSWVYAPGPTAWPLGALTGRIGRSQAPQLPLRLGVTGKGVEPLRLATPWTVPGDGPARAIIYGTLGDASAVELIDVDGGTIQWRDTSACAAPVVGVTAEVAVCADAKGTRAIGLDGKRRWASDAAFIAMTDDRVVTFNLGELVIVDAGTGHEIARLRLPVAKPPPPPPKTGRAVPPIRGTAAPAPAPIAPESIIASCGAAGRELFAYSQDGQLSRIAEAPGGPKIAWSVPVAVVVAIDACEGGSVLVTTSGDRGPTLIALARDTGKQTGRIEGVRGFWPARDGSARLEVSTLAGVAVWSRELVATEPTALPPLGELLAKRGDRRLVRASPSTAVLLDLHGVHGYLAIAELGAVLGDRAIVAASWLGSSGETVHRIAIPSRYEPLLRVPVRREPVTVPAELRDLPKLVQLDVAGAIALPDTGKHAVTSVALDPIESRSGYALALEHVEGDATRAGVARFDLAARRWAWFRGDGCGPGTPLGLAVSRLLVACAARSSKDGTVIATTRDGSPLWQWRGHNVDAVDAAADIVMVRDADRVYVLDGRDGKELATYASDDGAPLRAAVLDLDGAAMLVTYQHGRVVGRLAHVQMMPVWALAIDGVVRSMAPSVEGVLVDLEDGDAYRVDARTGSATALPGLDLVWRATGDLITGQAPGGPIPPVRVAAPARPGLPVRRPPPSPPAMPPDPNAPPVFPKVWPAPPPMPASWQYTLYELRAGLRARNDYPLEPPITPATVRGPGDSPLVVQSGPGLRDVLVIDSRHGDPLRRVHMPDDAAPGLAFSTIVDGAPVVGTLLANPLRVVLF